jgi:diguanylate cyclase (GGDEF)-like protein
MLNLDLGFRRLAWVVSLVLGVPLVGFGMLLISATPDHPEGGYFFALAGIGAFILTWAVFFTGHWIVRGFKAIASSQQSNDEVGTLMTSYNHMLETIEQQAAEINSFATRLDAAYKELESTNARLKESVFKDDVTGLYNRRFFHVRLEEELSRYRRFNHPVSVVLLKLDGFKAVNDDLGRAIGDDTLRNVAQILMKHSRGINVVSRYDADLFAVVLVETSKVGARLYADRIGEEVANSPFSHGRIITARFGIASMPDAEASTAEDLFHAADEALRVARQ